MYFTGFEHQGVMVALSFNIIMIGTPVLFFLERSVEAVYVFCYIMAYCDIVQV